MRRRRIRARRGQALVEFALLSPILMLIVLGIVEFGRAWNAYQTITDAAREATRTAVVNNGAPIDSIYNTINRALARVGLDSTAESTTIVGWQSGTGNPTTVQVSYPYHMGWISGLLGWTGAQSDITLKTSIAMRQE